jgi:hypothetical protein
MAKAEMTVSGTVDVQGGSTVVVRPGDRLVVALHEARIDQQQIAQMTARLSAKLPGVEVTFVPGVAALAVMPATLPVVDCGDCTSCPSRP